MSESRKVIMLRGKPVVVGEPITQELLDAISWVLRDLERERESAIGSLDLLRAAVSPRSSPADYATTWKR